MYATVEDLVLVREDEITVLSNRGTSDVLDRAAIETAIGYAGSEVDSYLSPVTPCRSRPGSARGHDGDGGYRPLPADVRRRVRKDPIVTRYKATVAWLKDVASGVVSLSCAGAVSGETSGSVEINPGKGTGNAEPYGSARRRCCDPENGLAGHTH
ncbi:MAG: phage protein Gp36 family protein [Bilophila wadsworthia]